MPSVANGDSLPFVGPKAHLVLSLKTPVARGGGLFNSKFKIQNSRIKVQISYSANKITKKTNSRKYGKSN